MPNWRSIGSYLTLALAPLAITVVVGLTAGAILAQSNPPGPGVSKQDEPIKRTVLFRGDLEGAPGKEIVVFVADLTPEAVGAKHYHPGPEFFYVLEGTLTHELEDGSTHMMKNGGFRFESEQGNSPHQEPERDRAGARYRFSGCGERPAHRGSS